MHLEKGEEVVLFYFILFIFSFPSPQPEEKRKWFKSKSKKFQKKETTQKEAQQKRFPTSQSHQNNL